jgi:predicted nucleotidyltransferase
VSGAALRHEVGADAAVAASIEHCVHVLRERLGSRLVGIVLTGSFARGEGTVVPIDGHLRVLGDIEFLVICPTAATTALCGRRWPAGADG